MSEAAAAFTVTPELQIQLDDLAGQLYLAKQKEDDAKAERIEIEEKIAARIPTADQGQRTVQITGKAKLTVKRSLSHKADFDAIEKVMAGSKQASPVRTKTTRELDVKGYEYYRTNNPELFAALSQHVEVTPRKPAVTLTLPKS